MNKERKERRKRGRKKGRKEGGSGLTREQLNLQPDT